MWLVLPFKQRGGKKNGFLFLKGGSLILILILRTSSMSVICISSNTLEWTGQGVMRSVQKQVGLSWWIGIKGLGRPLRDVFIGRFWHHLQMYFDGMWSWYDRQLHVSFPWAIQDMHYAVLCSGLEHLAKMEEKVTLHDIASYTAKRHQLVCWQAYISVNWAVLGFCMPFRKKYLVLKNLLSDKSNEYYFWFV